MMFCVFNNYRKVTVLFLCLVLVSFINPVIPFPLSNNAIVHNDSIVLVGGGEEASKERAKKVKWELRDCYTGRMGARHI